MKKNQNRFLRINLTKDDIEKFKNWEIFGEDYIIQKILSSPKQLTKEFFNYLIIHGSLENKSHIGKIVGYIKRVFKVLDPVGKLKQTIGVCGKSWKVGQPAFKCKTCETDPTCAICQECFKNGNHEGHNFSMITFSSGICDCGDPESWSVDGFCSKHKGTEVDPLEHLPTNLLSFCRVLTQELIEDLYIYLNERKSNQPIEKEKKPVSIPQPQESVAIRNRLNTQLRNLRGIENPTDEQRSMLLIIQTILSRMPEEDLNFFDEDDDDEAIGFDEPVIVEYIRFLEFLAVEYPCFKRLYYESFGSSNIMEKLLKNHVKYRRINREILSKFYSTCISDIMFKTIFSREFLKNYSSYMCGISKWRQKNFFLTTISVQFFTVPLIIDDLISSNLMNTVLDTILNFCSEFFNEKIVYRNVINPTRIGDAYIHLLYDFRYIFNNKKPSYLLLTSQVYLNKFLEFLGYLQYHFITEKINSDSFGFKRSFRNEFSVLPKLFKIIIKNALSQINFSNLNLIKNILNEIVKKIKKVDEKITPMVFKNQKLNVDGPISFHIPLHKFFSLLLHEILNSYPKITINDLFLQKDSKTIYSIIKYPLKILSTVCHVERRFWPRNNMGIQTQALSYSKLYQDYSILNDFFLSQIFCKILQKNEFINFLVEQFRVNDLFFCVDSKNLDEKEIDIEFDFLKFFLQFYYDRSLAGNTYSENIFNNIIHKLFCGEKEYSKLKESIPNLFCSGKKDEVKNILNKVSVFRQAENLNEKSVFKIKKSFWKEFNPYFVTYNIKNFTKASENRIKNGIKNDDYFADFIENFHQKEERFTSMEKFCNFLNSNIIHKMCWINLYRVLNNLEYSDQNLKVTMHIIYTLIVQEKNFGSTLTENEEDVVMLEKKTKIDTYKDIIFGSERFITNLIQPIEINDKRISILDMLFEIKNRRQSKFVLKIIEFLESFSLNEDLQKILKKKSNMFEKQIKKERELQRKSKAQKHREKIMKKMKRMKTKFDDSIEDLFDDDDEECDTCVFCHSKKSTNGETCLLYLTNLTKSKSLKVIEKKNLQDLNYPVPSELIKPTNLSYYHELFYNINSEEGIQINFCSHLCHNQCFHNYWKFLVKGSSTPGGFKGSHILILGNTEVLCPICSRLENSLLLKLDDQTVDQLCKDVNVNLQKNEEFSVVNSVKSFYHKVGFLKFGVPDHPSCNCLLLINAVSYNIATLEQVQREKPFTNLDEKVKKLFLNFIKSTLVCVRLESSTLVKLKLLKKSLFGKVCEEEFQFCDKDDDVEMKDNNDFSDLIDHVIDPNESPLPPKASTSFSIDPNDFNIFLPFLSNDMFSFFIRYIFLDYKHSFLFKKEMLLSLNKCFLGKILQLCLMLNLNYNIEKSEVSNENLRICNYLNEKIQKFTVQYGKDIKKKVITVQNQINFINSSLITFLKRVSLFFSVFFERNFPKTEVNQDEVLTLLKFLNLNLNFLMLKLNDHLIDSWLKQFFMQYKKNHTFFTPIPVTSKGFQFIKLPKLYQDLYLKFGVYVCKKCNKEVKHPVLELCLGIHSYSEVCDCEKSEHKDGNITRNFEGTGIYILVKYSCILLMRNLRKTYLKSPYRDEHGEDDLGLKSGKVLYLNQNYLNELIPMFILNSFDQNTKILSKSSTHKVKIL